MASANVLIRSWVIAIQSLTPSSSPTAARSSSNVLNTRIAASLQAPDVGCSLTRFTCESEAGTNREAAK
ncbi:MAG: hypothetical protein WDO24_10710 [Pseudomonadota bacterium]